MRKMKNGGYAVYIARHGAQGFECGDFVGQRERPDVARMPDFVDVAQEFPQFVVERAVGVGDDADAFHPGQNV